VTTAIKLARGNALPIHRRHAPPPGSHTSHDTGIVLCRHPYDDDDGGDEEEEEEEEKEEDVDVEGPTAGRSTVGE
jgi:hypothetical protein